MADEETTHQEDILCSERHLQHILEPPMNFHEVHWYHIDGKRVRHFLFTQRLYILFKGWKKKTYESRGVVVPDSLSVTKGLKHRVSLNNLILKISLSKEVRCCCML